MKLFSSVGCLFLTLIWNYISISVQTKILEERQRFVPPAWSERIQLQFGLKVKKMRFVSDSEGTITFDAEEHVSCSRHLLIVPTPHSGGRIYTLKQYFCSVNFGQSIYSPKRIVSGINEKLFERKI